LNKNGAGGVLVAAEAIQRRLMLDLIFVGSTIIFFLLALAYVRGCEKL
jgi:hypothetical protein